MVRLMLVVVCASVLSARVLAATPASQPDRQRAIDDLLAGRFSWTTAGPLVMPSDRPADPPVSIKDPSVVCYQGRWHLFASARAAKRTHAVDYLTFSDWKDANKAERILLPAYDGYWCAPEVFYFSPQKKWYLICQATNDAWTPKWQAAFSTTGDITDYKSWSKPAPLGLPQAEPGKGGLDFWVICDAAKAHLFFTSLDGRMWRSETKLADFPAGWSKPAVALTGDVFEASHTYCLKGLDGYKYLTLIEAQGGHGWRYYKAYLADRLDGPWKPLAADKENAFASMKNVRQPAGRWTDNVSHGELLRAGFDEKLEVDPANLRFLIQGVLDKDRAGKNYGEIPWRLGILDPAR